MTWIIHDLEKALLAGCDLVLDQTVYVLTGHDVESEYNNLLDERANDVVFLTDGGLQPPGGSEDHWAKLSPVTQEQMIHDARKCIEAFMGSGDWADAVRSAIRDTEKRAGEQGYWDV